MCIRRYIKPLSWLHIKYMATCILFSWWFNRDLQSHSFVCLLSNLPSVVKTLLPHQIHHGRGQGNQCPQDIEMTSYSSKHSFYFMGLHPLRKQRRIYVMHTYCPSYVLFLVVTECKKKTKIKRASCLATRPCLTSFWISPSIFHVPNHSCKFWSIVPLPLRGDGKSKMIISGLELSFHW